MTFVTALCRISTVRNRIVESRLMSPETAIAASHRAAQLENALRKVIRGKDDISAWRWFRCWRADIC